MIVIKHSSTSNSSTPDSWSTRMPDVHDEMVHTIRLPMIPQVVAPPPRYHGNIIHPHPRSADRFFLLMTRWCSTSGRLDHITNYSLTIFCHLFTQHCWLMLITLTPLFPPTTSPQSGLLLMSGDDGGGFCWWGIRFQLFNWGPFVIVECLDLKTKCCGVFQAVLFSWCHRLNTCGHNRAWVVNRDTWWVWWWNRKPATLKFVDTEKTLCTHLNST